MPALVVKRQMDFVVLHESFPGLAQIPMNREILRQKFGTLNTRSLHTVLIYQTKCCRIMMVWMPPRGYNVP